MFSGRRNLVGTFVEVTGILLIMVAGSQGQQQKENSRNGANRLNPRREKASTLDPQLQKVVDQLKSMTTTPINMLSPQEARKQPSAADAVKAVLHNEGKSTAPEPVGNVAERTIPGPGGTIPIRIYTPKSKGPFPVIVYFRGGGWVIANLDTYDDSARALTNATKALLVSVAYRQAPEHKFPAAADDANAATQWVIEHVSEIGGKPIVAVAGESAGGNLATVACMMARDKHGKVPVYQVLVYPITNYDLTTASYRDSGDGPILTKTTMEWFFTHYLKNSSDGQNPYASPLRGKVDGLPPATVVTDGSDVLRSEGMAYARKLRTAGIEVREKNYTSMTHEFFGMGAVVDQAKQAVQDAANDLKRAFAK